MAVVGSTRRSDGTPRMFKVDIPDMDCFFSGTGDMFAALTVVRFRQAAAAAGLLETSSWLSGDEVESLDLPLARSVEMVLASMQSVLEKTKLAVDEELAAMAKRTPDELSDSDRHLRKTKAAEVKLVRNAHDLMHPKVRYRAEVLEV